MGLGSALRKISVKEEGDYLLPALDLSIKSDGDLFSWGSLRVASESLEEAIEEKNLAKLFIAFDLVQKGVYANQGRDKSFLHASEILNACPRKLFYDLTGAEFSNPNAGKPNGRLQLIFDFGSWIHSYIQLNLQRAGVLEDIEVSVFDKDTLIGGRADAIISVPRRKVLEIKSTNSRKFASLKAPDPDHVTQASIYGKNLGIDTLHFMYICKDTSEIKEFIVPTDLLAVEKVESVAKEVISHVKSGIAPDRVCLNDISTKALSCKYCSYCFKK